MAPARTARRHLADRTARLDALLADRGVAAIWLLQPTSLQWLLGANTVVDRHASMGVAAAGYDGDSITVITNDIEADRLRDEELPSGVRVETFDWHASDLQTEVARRSPSPAIADRAVPGLGTFDPAAVRTPLFEDDVEAYRSLGRETAEVLEMVCRDARRDETERTVVNRLRSLLAERGIDAPVALVGGARRAPRYRHFVPQDEPLGDYFVASLTTERDGRYASTTRTVAFDAPDWLTDHHRIATTVEASALAATQQAGLSGGTAGDVFSVIREAYATQGWPDEWREHHQGGAAGYAGREWFATPESEVPIRLPMAFAWNPTVSGAKSEDTHLVREDDIETLTATGEWPTVTAESVTDDCRLERPAVLER